MTPPPKECTCRSCDSPCIFKVSWKVPYSICRQCQYGSHRKEKK